jgi:hypothetical protein
LDEPAAAVWPWLAQTGPSPRGGAYTYDWIENVLGLDKRSVDRILPSFQHPEIGDRPATARTGCGSNGSAAARTHRNDPSAEQPSIETRRIAPIVIAAISKVTRIERR